jgi:lysophospholipase L1-like esterase
MRPLVVACLGDSNSLSAGEPPSWIGLLRESLPSASYKLNSYATSGAAACRLDGLPNAWDQLEAALLDGPPDLVFLAFGTNDIAWMLTRGGRRREDLRGIVREYQALAAVVELAGAAAVIGLTPCPAPNRPSITDRAAMTRSLNEYIRSAFPKELVLDFETASSDPSDLDGDIHLSGLGQARRAALVTEWLSRLEVTEAGMPKLPSTPWLPYMRTGLDLSRHCTLQWYHRAWGRRLKRLARQVREQRTPRGPLDQSATES